MGSEPEAEELINCMNVITWNRRFLQTIGIWPLKVFDPIFVFSFIYLFLHCTLAFIDLTNYEKDLDVVIAYIYENLVLLSILIKITLCRLHRESLSEFLIDIENDFRSKNYRSRNEMLSFIRYNRLSVLFMALSVPSTTFAAIIYYFQSLTTNIKMVIDNSSIGYQLPYKTHAIVPINDAFTYTCYCLYQILFIPYISFGYVGLDTFFVTLSLHVSGQFSVLNNRVKDAITEPRNPKNGMKSLIISHRRLIRLADILEEDFNIGILQQLIITMWNMCMTGYNILKAASTTGQSVQAVIFVVFLLPAICTLFTYCYVGECLIQESTKFGEAIYDSEWYNISPNDLKLVLICMMRSRKPLQLTSGKFFVLSLCTFTDTLKTSMGYLSVVRTFMD